MLSVDWRKLQESIWLLIVLLTPLLVNIWVEQQFEASKVWLLRSLVWLLAILWMGGWVQGCRFKPPPPVLLKLIIILGLILSLATLLSTNLYIATFGSLDRAGGALTQLSYLLFFLCVATQVNGQQRRRLLQALILTALPIGLFGLAQGIGWQPRPVFTDARSSIITTLGRANFTGAYLALLLPLTLVAWQTAVTSWRRLGYAIVSALEMVVIVLTQARAAWLAAIVGVGVLWWLQAAPSWSKQVRQRSAVSGLIILGGALLLLLQYGVATGGSIAARWTIWRASLGLLWSRLWLGYGADTLELHFPSVYPPELVYYQGRGIIVDRAHNWLLDWSFNYGLVATAIFTTLVCIIVWEGWKRILQTESNLAGPLGEQFDEHRWLSACLAGICAQMVGNLFLFDVAATATVFWLYLAIVTAATNKKERQSLDRSIPRWGQHTAIVFALCVFVSMVWHSNVRPLLADINVWQGTRELSQNNFEGALSQYSLAADLQPNRAEYHVATALTAAQIHQFERAVRAMQQAIALRAGDPVLYTQLASIYARQAAYFPEKLALAYGAFEQAIDMAPTIAITFQQYADLTLRSGNVNGALMLAQRAVDLDETDGISFGIYGWGQLQNSNPLQAQAAFEEAVKWIPDSADFHLGLATAYYQQGKNNDALQAIQRSLALDPANDPALTLHLLLSR